MHRETASINHPNALSTQSHQDRASPKLVSHHVDSDKKNRKQIRNIEKAIEQENGRRGKANAGILKGLKKALDKLNDTRALSDQSSLPQSRRSWKQSSSPEKHTYVEELLCREPAQRATSLETQPSAAGFEESQSPTSVRIIEEQVATVSGPTSQQPLAGAQPTDFRVSTPESENIRGETFPKNGEKNQEEPRPAPPDHDMAGTETTVVDYFPLTEECHHYTSRSEVDWDIQK